MTVLDVVTKEIGCWMPQANYSIVSAIAEKIRDLDPQDWDAAELEDIVREGIEINWARRKNRDNSVPIAEDIARELVMKGVKLKAGV